MASVGDVFGGRYRLEELLGVGGMGQVFAARDVLLDRRVAVKVPSASSKRAGERFRHEARAAASLNHPNVVSVYDWGEDANGAYLVMELVEGHSLRDVLEVRRTLPPREVATVGAQIAGALEHAHAHGVVHRDVKPTNLLVTASGDIKVTDFGISKSASAEPLTDPGAVLGTPGYLAPEQAAGLVADARTDVYSLGVVLAELLTGSRDAPVDARATQLERIITRAREKDPAARYQRAGDLRDVLLAVIRMLDAPVTANPIGTRTLISAATLVATETRTTITSATSAVTAPPTATRIAPVVAPVALPAPPKVKPRKVPRRLRVKQPRPPRVKKPRRLRAKKVKKVTKPAQALPAPKPPSSRKRWRSRHVLAVVSAPLVLVAGGGFAYFWLARPDSVAVPNVVHRDVFTAASTLKKAGFEVDSIVTDNPRPGGVVLAQTPRRGLKADEGSTVTITISDIVATVPEVVGTPVDDALAALRHVGFVNLPVTDDYRDDVAAGTVVDVTPAAFSESSKTEPVTLSVARDPHVTVPNVVSLDQATATANLQQLGLVVAVKNGSSSTVPAGNVISANPGAGRVLVRGVTVTLTVSTGPQLVKVPYVVSWSADDARHELEDAGFAVSIATAPVPNSYVGDVVAEDPPGGQAPKGTTVTITVGARQAKK